MIDYLTLVLAGSILVYAGDAWEQREARPIITAWVMMLGGMGLFAVGTIRAFQGATGL